MRLNQKQIALIGHIILFAGTIWGAAHVAAVGLFDFFFWSGLVIGVWAGVGTPKARDFSFGLGIAQIALQTLVIISLFVYFSLEEMESNPGRRGGSEGGEFFLLLTMFKSFLVFLIAAGVTRGIYSLIVRLSRRPA